MLLNIKHSWMDLATEPYLVRVHFGHVFNCIVNSTALCCYGIVSDSSECTAVAQWSEYLQLKQEALGSIPGGCPVFFQLAYTNEYG